MPLSRLWLFLLDQYLAVSAGSRVARRVGNRHPERLIAYYDEFFSLKTQGHNVTVIEFERRERIIVGVEDFQGSTVNHIEDVFEFVGMNRSLFSRFEAEFPNPDLLIFKNNLGPYASQSGPPFLCCLVSPQTDCP